MELIKIYQGNLVDARELHQFLESKRQFGNWIQERIKKYDFKENVDYSLLNKFVKQKGRGGHNAKEYSLTLNMAKELAMVENNDKGRQARRYFIEVEQALIQLRQNKRLEHFLKLEAQKDKLSANILSIGGNHKDYIQIDLEARKVFFNGQLIEDELLPEVLLAARGFATAMTNEGFKSEINTLDEADNFHKKNHSDVRDLLKQNTGKLPEELKPESDIKKLKD